MDQPIITDDVKLALKWQKKKKYRLPAFGSLIGEGPHHQWAFLAGVKGRRQDDVATSLERALLKDAARIDEGRVEHLLSGSVESVLTVVLDL